MLVTFGTERGSTYDLLIQYTVQTRVHQKSFQLHVGSNESLPLVVFVRRRVLYLLVCVLHGTTNTHKSPVSGFARHDL